MYDLLDEVHMNRAQGGLLPSSYFDGSRNQLMSALIASFQADKFEVEEDVIISGYEIESIREIYYATVEVVKSQYGHYLSDVKKCFIPFCKTGRYSVIDGEVKVYFVSGKDYVVNKYLFDSFHYHKGYNTVANMHLILHDYECEIIREVEYFPSRAQGSGGQMKIAVDAILAVDAISGEGEKKILIVGSSHEPMYEPKSSYASLPYMISGEIDMYDPLEEEGSEMVGRVKVNRIKGYYDYKDVDKYDLVIDDGYAHGRPTEGDVVNRVEHFSVKSFAESPFVNNYHQVCFTPSREVRLVSRSLVPDYSNEDRLGSCLYCRELKYYLRRRYDDEMYYAFFVLHPNDVCRARGYYRFRQRYHEEGKKGFVPPIECVDYVLTDQDRISYKDRVVSLYDVQLRRLKVDKYFYNIPEVELRVEHLRNVYVLLTTMTFFVKELMHCKGVYYYDGRNDMLKFYPTTKVRLVVGGNTEAMSYSQDRKQARINKAKQNKGKVSVIIDENKKRLKTGEQESHDKKKNKMKSPDSKINKKKKIYRVKKI